MFLLAGAGDVPIVVGLLLDRQCLSLRSRQEVGHLQVCPFLDGLLLQLWFGLGHCRRAHNMHHTARGPVTGYDCGYEGLDCPTKLPIVCRLALESGLVVVVVVVVLAQIERFLGQGCAMALASFLSSPDQTVPFGFVQTDNTKYLKINICTQY